MRSTIIIIIALWLAACDRQQVTVFDNRDGGGTTSMDGDVVIPGLTRLEIRPPSARIVADGLTPGVPFTFNAFGTFPDGERDVSSLVSWSIEDSTLGELSGGVFTANGRAGGTTLITASAEGVSANASLTVFLDVDALGPGAPANASTFFPSDVAGDTVTGNGRPAIVYPSNETMFPLNALYTLFQWRAPADLDLFELRFESNVAVVRWYTTDRTFLLDELAREWIAHTHAGRSASISVRGLSTTSTGTVYRSDPILVEYSKSAVTGSIYYWSTGAKAILRASLDANTAEKFYPEEADDTCGSCHTVSRDGRKIALGYGGEKLRVASIPEREVVVGDNRAYGWSTFSPDGKKLLVANKGVLDLLELDAGTTTRVTLPMGSFGTHPDWAPDGRHVAFVLTRMAPGNKDVKGSSLARMAVMGDGSFGAPEILIPNADGEDTIAFPAHSPDSRWIAFVRTRGKSKDSKPSELYLVRADGSSAPQLLERLNRRVRQDDGIITIGNSMPTWAPSSRPEINWIAFSSIRDYGDILDGTERDQLWVAAIDLDRAASGEDPSYPAFWLPFQSIDEGNHRAFWSLNPDDACPSTTELCDGFDNNCNGVVDDNCCTPTPDEMCNDAIDNDCDGLIDEACGGCAEREVCNDSLDNDCDELIDLQDEDCSV